jgi:aryl-alcohol dehydrogenase-like predicted oxidoreductase
MRYRRLGRAGFDVSDIAHGLWGMGGWKDSADEQSLTALQDSVDLGCNFFDSAWAYGDGHSDGLLGEIMRRNPDKRIYAASKIPPKNRKWPASSKDSYSETFPMAHVLRHADLIREKLGRDTIDLLQFHVWDDHWADEPEFRQTVEKLKHDDIVTAFGLSLNRWEPENGLKAIRTGLVDTVQVIYNIFDQAPADELFEVCREKKIGVIARVPLDEGSLGGKLEADTRFPAGDWRNNYFNEENLAATLPRVEALKSHLHGITLPELALRFILSERTVSTTIVGMRKPDHVRQNIAASDAGPLSAALLEELRKHRWDRKPQKWSA